MSFKATEWAYGLRDLSGPEKAVLLCLAWHHNGKTGLCCPGTALIAEETCLGLSTVKKALKSLEGKGLIGRMPWKRGSAYMLAIVEPERPRETSPEATTEPAHIKQETNRKRGGFRNDWKERQPAPMSDARARAEKRAAEFKAVIEPEVKDRGTEEERAAVIARGLGIFRGLIPETAGDRPDAQGGSPSSGYSPCLPPGALQAAGCSP